MIMRSGDIAPTTPAALTRAAQLARQRCSSAARVDALPQRQRPAQKKSTQLALSACFGGP